MIHVAITRRVRPGHEEQFEQALRRFLRQAEERPETLGAFMLLPAAGASKREYGILRAFRDRAAEDAFYASDVYRTWSESVREHVEGEPEKRQLHGLEAFFRQDAASAPPKWKMAILTWLAVNPAVYVCSRVIPAIASDLPALALFALVNAGVVTLLTWVLMPIFVRLAKPWLTAAHSRARFLQTRESRRS
ncbi:MAG: antibiotic biosynthesis monooxygenase [Polyangiaceae bacterium]|nr:antibiotic biosynthesis monooxygenase [Polyangiaceae bacterium]